MEGRWFADGHLYMLLLCGLCLPSPLNLPPAHSKHHVQDQLQSTFLSFPHVAVSLLFHLTLPLILILLRHSSSTLAHQATYPPLTRRHGLRDGQCGFAPSDDHHHCASTSRFLLWQSLLSSTQIQNHAARRPSVETCPSERPWQGRRG